MLAAGLATPFSASAAPKRPTLAGTVRITATTSGYVDVRLPRAVNMGDGYHPPKGTSIAGDGRVVGLMLLAAKQRAHGVKLLKYGLCVTAGCRQPGPDTYFIATDGAAPYNQDEILPAGDYRLLVVADGKPVTVVLTFPGLKGTLNLKAARPAHTTHAAPDYTVGTGALPAHGFATGSAPVSVDGGLGILLHQFKADTDMTVQQHGGFCLYNDTYVGEPAPECPGGHGGDINITRVNMEKGRWAMVGHYSYLDEGNYRAGSFYRTIGVAKAPLGVITTIIVPPF